MKYQKSLVRQVRDRLKLNQSDFAKRIGVSQGSIAKWEKMGVETPKNADMTICLALGMELWEYYIPDEINENIKASMDPDNKTQELANKINKLDEKQKGLIEQIIESFSVKKED